MSLLRKYASLPNCPIGALSFCVRDMKSSHTRTENPRMLYGSWKVKPHETVSASSERCLHSSTQVIRAGHVALLHSSVGCSDSFQISPTLHGSARHRQPKKLQGLSRGRPQEVSLCRQPATKDELESDVGPSWVANCRALYKEFACTSVEDG